MRPTCSNCVRRSNDCEYDERPRRRGPDKRPGTRQRSCKKRPADGSAPPPKRRKVIAEEDERPQAKSTESSLDSRTSDRYSPKVYQSDANPPAHLPAAPASDSRIGEPSWHPKVCGILAFFMAIVKCTYRNRLLRIDSHHTSTAKVPIFTKILILLLIRDLNFLQIFDVMGSLSLVHLNVSSGCGGIQYSNSIRKQEVHFQHLFY